MTQHPIAGSPAWVLADADRQFFVGEPGGHDVSVDLAGLSGRFEARPIDAATGTVDEKTAPVTIQGGNTATLRAPHGRNNLWWIVRA